MNQDIFVCQGFTIKLPTLVNYDLTGGNADGQSAYSIYPRDGDSRVDLWVGFEPTTPWLTAIILIQRPDKDKRRNRIFAWSDALPN
ncbi:hypothetical protein H1P_350029 [Hyella patelloides LEGE 07179]|uniref:Uncharacterized protein n=1 Tax=Hyella patelloides LEGE 07179 TaxID=945734 RepID=A0A563VVW4_9CYAN|nr:hypothetical protein H1P_350029 [Hyella patelloides LEGE 07179]